MFRHPIVRYTIAVLIGGAALYFAFHKQHIGQLREELEGANLFVIIAGTFVTFLSHPVRAWRYKMFLRPIAPHTRLGSAFRALIAGYATNNIIPRAGDITRPVLFSKREEIPVSSSVAVLAIERLADLIGLSGLLGATILVFHEKLSLEFPAIEDFTYTIAGILFAICALAILILLSERKTKKVIHFLARGLPKKARTAIENAANRIEEGLKGIRQGTAIPALLGTLGISALYTASMYVSTLAFPNMELRHVGFIGCFLLQSVSGIAFIMPSPGGTGTYHFLISQSLAALFGVPPEAAIAFATLTHASNYILTTATGFAFMTIDGISIASVKEEARSEAKRPHIPRIPAGRNESRIAAL
jgi:uncharacterized protein (TIRG00374 family)